MKTNKRKRYQWLLFGLMVSIIGPLSEWLLFSLLPKDSEQVRLISYLYAEISALIVFGLFGYILGSYADRVESLAVTDRLTGLYNRHHMMLRLEELTQLQQRYGEHFSLIMLDLDHFKAVNDQFGHMVGDQTLKAVSTTLADQLRDTDIPCRYGGEEFLVVCPHTHLDECYLLAERIRAAIEQLGPQELGHPGPQTLSAGVFEVQETFSAGLMTALNCADEALYQAKKAGRNRVARGAI
ncbi:MAG: GGDEF domain-containing protein [bacterium]|nr:GGDEF domain-containing protein [bacterium]